MPQVYVKPKRGKPSQSTDLVWTALRGTRYGELMAAQISDPLNMLADEGSYFTAMTATPGTGYNLTGATQTGFVATTPTLTIYNGEAAGTYKRYYLDMMRVCWTAAPTAAASCHGCIVVDTGNRYSGSGTALTVYNCNEDDTTTSNAVVYGGAITATSASSPRYLHRFTLSSAIPVIGETYSLAFGEQSIYTSANKGAVVGPVVIGPGQTALVYLWLPSQSATGQGEVNLNWWER